MLKLVAALLMVLDHIGLLFFPYGSPIYTFLRLIGRFSMPIFAYSIASGFIYTKDLHKYISRILGMTLLAQIPYTLVRYHIQIPLTDIGTLMTDVNFILSSLTHWNIGMTFAAALLVLYLIPKQHNSWLATVGIFAILYLSSGMDYGFYGILLVILFYYYQTKFIAFNRMFVCFIVLCAFNTLAWLPNDLLMGSLYSFLPLGGLLLIKYVPNGKIRLPKYFFYAFYPLHLLILWMLYTIFV